MVNQVSHTRAAKHLCRVQLKVSQAVVSVAENEQTRDSAPRNRGEILRQAIRQAIEHSADSDRDLANHRSRGHRVRVAPTQLLHAHRAIAERVSVQLEFVLLCQPLPAGAPVAQVEWRIHRHDAINGKAVARRLEGKPSTRAESGQDYWFPRRLLV